ncbi:MAG: hypothetical protein IT331_13800 [Anaerolineae bacterium]|nr:hypothetical protein [Anaerolineae bacterium]
MGLDIGANAEFTLAGKSMEEATSQLTVEQKLSNLIRYMEAHKGYEFFGNLVSAAARLESSGGSVFVEIREKFSLPQFYSGQDGVAAVNSSKTLMFELGEPTSPNAPFTDDYSTYSDDYYKGRSNIRVIMNASLGKLVRTSGEMGQHSHDAILFRGFQGRKVPLTVFGHLTSVAHLFCQIKPYAIWL